MQAGFLGDKPVKPTSAEALEKLFAESLEKAASLRAILDPEDQPYLSRYEERNVLAVVADQAAANEAVEPAGSVAAVRARSIGGIINVLIGRNFMETEEPGMSQVCRRRTPIRLLFGSRAP